MTSILLQVKKEGDAYVIVDPSVKDGPTIAKGSSLREAAGDWLLNNPTKARVYFTAGEPIVDELFTIYNAASKKP